VRGEEALHLLERAAQLGDDVGARAGLLPELRFRAARDEAPWWSTRIRSHVCEISERMWLDTSTVDSCRRSRTTWRISTICTGVEPADRLVEDHERGLWMIACAMPTRFLNPWLSSAITRARCPAGSAGP
jgi:hypothetical protein